jgi:hypothetical protein
MGCEIERGSPEVLFLAENVPENFTDADNPHQPPRNQDKSARSRPINRPRHESGMEIS